MIIVTKYVLIIYDYYGRLYMNINQLRCPNCGANIMPNNNSNMLTCAYCNSTYALDFNSGYLTKIVNNNVGTSNVEAANVTINNYYSPQQPSLNNYQNNMITGNYASSAGGTAVSDKNRTTVVILCVFLGFFGVHYFYVNKIGLGLLYLFTWGLFGFGWLIDIIRTVSGSFPDEHGRPITVW